MSWGRGGGCHKVSKVCWLAVPGVRCTGVGFQEEIVRSAGRPHTTSVP